MGVLKEKQTWKGNNLNPIFVQYNTAALVDVLQQNNEGECLHILSPICLCS